MRNRLPPFCGKWKCSSVARAAILEKNGPPAGGEFRSALEELQGEVATLARFLSGADKLLSDWLTALQTRRGGYTHRGQAAPLVLVNKVTVEG